MGILFRFVVWLDTMLLSLAAAIVEEANEWLSLSKTRCEWILFGASDAFLIASIVARTLNPSHTWFYGVPLATGVVSFGMVFWVQWTTIRLPAIMRSVLRLRNLSLRIVYLCCGLGWSLPSFQKSPVTDNFWGVGTLLTAALFYVVFCEEHGEPGRKRRLTLSELKKLFGTEWMPKPVPQQ